MSTSRTTKVVALSVGQILSQVIGMATAMLMARMLTKADFAAYRQTLMAFGTATPLFGLGIAQSLYYFLPGEKDRVRGRILDCFLLLFLSGIILAGFIALGGNKALASSFHNPKVETLLLFMMPCAIIGLPAGMVASALVARGDAVASSGLSVASQLLIGVATIVSLVCWATPEAALTGYVLATVICGFFSIVILLRRTPADSTRRSLPVMKTTLLFSIPLAVSTLIGQFSMQLGSFFVSVTSSPELFAVFSVGARELPLGILTSAVTTVLLADMAAHFSRGETEAATILWRRATSKASLLLIPLFVFLMAFADDYILYMYTSEYSASIPLFRIFLLLIPLRSFFFGAILLAAGESRFILMRTAAWAIVGCLCSAVLFQMYGLYGVAWGIVLSQYFFAAPVNFYRISRLTDLKWTELGPYREQGLMFLGAGLPLLVCLPVRLFVGDAVGLILASILYVMLVSISFLCLRLVSPAVVRHHVSRVTGWSLT